MIVDLRTRLHRCPRTEAGEEAAGDQACVAISALIGAPPGARGEGDSADSLMRCVGEAPGARIAFIGVNPLLEDAIERTDTAVERGVVGVTISPADQGYRPTHDRCMQLTEHCAKNNLPLLVANPEIQKPFSVLEFARPVLIDELARQHPDATIIMGDLGHGWIDETLSLIAKHQHVYAEISGVVRRSWALYSTLMSAFERGLLQRLLFGSGYPDEKPETAIERIYTINSVRAGSSLPTIPRESLRSFVERDALRCIGLEQPQSNSRVEPARERLAASEQAAEAGA
jgi:predicted TIM-barrel fold metal-dependent hydrolase